jgi:cytochrome c oxidase assembly protein subunit 15
LLGTLLALLVGTLWICCKRIGLDARASRAVHVLLAVVGLQIGLGIATLLLRVPVALGSAHQGVAVLVFAVALWTAHSLRKSSSRIPA